MKRQKEDDAKLRELVLLIATLSEGDEPFGKIKLNKVAFFSDFLAYLIFGRSITGHQYMRLPEGPAPRKLLLVIPAFRKPAEKRPRHCRARQRLLWPQPGAPLGLAGSEHKEVRARRGQVG